MPGIGMTLRSARIQRGVSIEQVAQDTRISARFLEALEDEAFEELPAPVYVRGFLRSYSNYLRLDPQPLVEQLPALLRGSEPAAVPAGPQDPNAEPPRRSPDPFRPAAPARPMVIGDDPPLRAAALQAAEPFSPRRFESETLGDGSGYEPNYRRGHVGGVLMERGGVYEDNGRIVRFAAIVGGAFVVVVLIAFGMTALGGGGGRQDTLANGDETPRATATSNPIVVGSATAAPSGVPTETTTPEGEETPTPTEEATATPTEELDEPTATPTQPPATPTPTIVIPTATPTVASPNVPGSGFSECPEPAEGQYDCDPPMRVICPPNGEWFVDYNDDFPVAEYGWFWATANDNGEALEIGAAGCR